MLMYVKMEKGCIIDHIFWLTNNMSKMAIQMCKIK